jgi:hypothetical protein
LAFEAARFRWLPLDDTDVEVIRARLEALPRSPSAARMLGILNRIRPVVLTRRIEAIQDLVDLGQPATAAWLAQRCLLAEDLSPGLADKLNKMAWYWLDPRAPRADAREVALIVARGAAEASKRSDPNILDTLAEALFANANYAQACDVEEEALSKCAADATNSRAGFEASLARFRSAGKAVEAGARK